MIEMFPKGDSTEIDMCKGCRLKDEERKHVKYLKALKTIEEALINWAYENDKGFVYFVDGIIQASKDWED